MNSTDLKIWTIEDRFIKFLASNKRKNLSLLIKGNLYEFFDNVKKCLADLGATSNYGGDNILCAYNAVQNDLSVKFMQEVYMNPDTNNVIEEEGNVEISKAMLLINTRKPSTKITHEVFDKTNSMKKISMLNVEQILGLAREDIEKKKNLVCPEDKKPPKSFDPDEAIRKAIYFIHNVEFENYTKRTNENESEDTTSTDGKFIVLFQEKWNWHLMLNNITEWFSKLLGYSNTRNYTRYFEVKSIPMGLNKSTHEYPALICIYLVWGQAGRTIPIDYKIRDGKIERVAFVVAANSAEVFVHEFYHCLQAAETFIWRIPTDCLEYGAIKFERDFRQKHTKDYVLYRQYMQIAYGIAGWSDSAEEFDRKFNELMGLTGSAHFSRQFIPRLSMGKYYYAYSLGFMDNLPRDILKTLRKYSP